MLVAIFKLMQFFSFSSPNDAMLDMITDLQSERMDSQRAELRPAPNKLTLESKGASLPGLRPQQTTSAKPEDDFLDMIARVQVRIC